MNQSDIYMTINHLGDYCCTYTFKPGDVITLKKDKENIYDDEAIAAYGKHGTKCGYVANSVSSVARGTYSSGRIYDKVPDEFSCAVCFVTEEALIAKINEGKGEDKEGER